MIFVNKTKYKEFNSNLKQKIDLKLSRFFYILNKFLVNFLAFTIHG